MEEEDSRALKDIAMVNIMNIRGNSRRRESVLLSYKDINMGMGTKLSNTLGKRGIEQNFF